MQAARLAGRSIAALTLCLGVLGGCASTGIGRGDIQPGASGEDAEPTRPVLAMNDNGIGPGPFNPGRQPVPCYVGNEVHRVIGAFYQSMHLLDTVFLNTSPLSRILDVAQLPRLRRTPRSVLATRPDILNLTRRHLYEIKSLAQADDAITQMVRYRNHLRRAGLAVVPGPVGEPGTQGVLPAPRGHVFFYTTLPGVILYQCDEGRYEPATETSTAPSISAAAAAAAKKRSATRSTVDTNTDPSLADPWWKKSELVAEVAALTGLTGTALIAYLILSEGSRFVLWPRNLLPAP